MGKGLHLILWYIDDNFDFGPYPHPWDVFLQQKYIALDTSDEEIL